MAASPSSPMFPMFPSPPMSPSMSPPMSPSMTPSVSPSMSPFMSPSLSPFIAAASSGVGQFTTVDDFFRMMDWVSTDKVIVRGVSAQDFDEIDRERENRGLRFRFRYSAATGTLIVRVPTDLHEELHLGLYRDNFTRRLDQANLRQSWRSMGKTAYGVRQDQPGGDDRGGDSTGGPKPQRGSKGAWPTLVVEAGDSETLEELRNEMRRWFESSDHQVKIVLLAKFDGISGEIILEKWVEAQAQAGPSGTGPTTPAVIRGAVAAQEAPQLVPDRSQVITITPDTRVTDSLGYWNHFHSSAYAVAGGDLRLEFDRLFLRQPDQAAGEGDFIIGIEELQDYAREVWFYGFRDYGYI